jgi:hypothetical protein
MPNRPALIRNKKLSLAELALYLCLQRKLFLRRKPQASSLKPQASSRKPQYNYKFIKKIHGK